MMTPMCGRFFLSTSAAEIARSFELTSPPPPLAPRFNIAPGQAIPVVRALSREAPGRAGRVLELLRWGLAPTWMRAAAVHPINARAESAAELPLFREALARRRGLVPANGFYEWQHRGRSARPFAVRLRGGALFAMAALWERGAQEEPGSCAIVTTEANERVRAIHGRMPLVIAPEDFARWLDPERADVAELLQPWPADGLDLHPVDARVNDVRNDDARLTEPERDLFSG
jgi:putative SOS response-associated peptidase YedK